ncbi:hypothetical protein [Pelagicoccus mobilis]|uniref:Uncharacterized protein n=1 Tax=Pelagicoccus mobilis TaxID=415221 RepID=A0A934S3V6_9BACT|nr:hypothetical protein [Pelagicoccus mobilis]MBK1879297.1 hypothetical protein [Pelagicoccus mobilis]
MNTLKLDVLYQAEARLNMGLWSYVGGLVAWFWVLGSGLWVLDCGLWDSGVGEW